VAQKGDKEATEGKVKVFRGKGRNFTEGVDLTEALGVTKWEPPRSEEHTSELQSQLRT
jgi:enoyl-CoA hydratase/carnithine racemase